MLTFFGIVSGCFAPQKFKELKEKHPFICLFVLFIAHSGNNLDMSGCHVSCFLLNNKRIKKSIELLCCIFLGFTHPKSLKDKATTFTVTFWVCFLVLSPPKKRIKQNPFNLFFSCPLRFSLRKN